MSDTHLRAGDADREAVAAALGTHMAEGRLTLAEYDERLSRAYAARTFGELAELTADLPALEPAAPRPVTPAPGLATFPRPAPTLCGLRAMPVPPPMASWAWHGRPEHSWRAWLATSVTVLAIYLAISLATWEFSYFWPVWVIGPWGAVLLASTVTAGHDGGEEPRGT